jgi:hypothetical protein
VLYPLSYGRSIVRKAVVYQRFWRIPLSVMAQRRVLCRGYLWHGCATASCRIESPHPPCSPVPVTFR